jgi:hypothetical protein
MDDATITYTYRIFNKQLLLCSVLDSPSGGSAKAFRDAVRIIDMAMTGKENDPDIVRTQTFTDAVRKLSSAHVKPGSRRVVKKTSAK